jgi:hypothetical protein
MGSAHMYIGYLGLHEWLWANYFTKANRTNSFVVLPMYRASYAFSFLLFCYLSNGHYKNKKNFKCRQLLK